MTIKLQCNTTKHFPILPKILNSKGVKNGINRQNCDRCKPYRVYLFNANNWNMGLIMQYLFNVYAKGDFSVTTIMADSIDDALKIFCDHRGLNGVDPTVYAETNMENIQIKQVN